MLCHFDSIKNLKIEHNKRHLNWVYLVPVEIVYGQQQPAPNANAYQISDLYITPNIHTLVNPLVQNVSTYVITGLSLYL